MKINLNYQFKALNGKPFDKYLKDEKGKVTDVENDAHNMAKCLAMCLFYSAEKNLKFKLWAEELYKKGSFEIDEVDFDLLIAWVELYGTNPNVKYEQWFSQIGIKGQVIETMKKQKNK